MKDENQNPSKIQMCARDVYVFWALRVLLAPCAIKIDGLVLSSQRKNVEESEEESG